MTPGMVTIYGYTTYIEITSIKISKNLSPLDGWLPGNPLLKTHTYYIYVCLEHRTSCCKSLYCQLYHDS